MRINRFVAQASGLSRRAADAAVAAGRVRLNGSLPLTGQAVRDGDTVTLDGQVLAVPAACTTVMLNKPTGYVCSRRGQGSRTMYDLLPPELCQLKPVGRLDKDSSGLLLLTDDGELANRLTHPRFGKQKVYEIELDQPLRPADRQQIATVGVSLEDGPSRLQLRPQAGSGGRGWLVTMREGRNRQIRRTFAALGHRVVKLHRIQFGSYELGAVPPGQFRTV